MEKEIDSGPIFDVEKIKIGKFETAGQLRKNVMRVLLVVGTFLNGILIGKIEPHRRVPKIYWKRGLEDGEINLLPKR